MRKKIAAALAVMVVASACLTACSKADMDAATGELLRQRLPRGRRLRLSMTWDWTMTDTSAT